MHGNVWEWMNTARLVENRYYCGGRWGDSADDCAAGNRGRSFQNVVRWNLGFRLCADRRAY